MNAHEVNFDCLVGPTHHFGGLSLGNLASHKNKARVSNPRAAALQGLKKMEFLSERGFIQAILPPHPRPHFPTLKRLGFLGSPEQMCQEAYDLMPELFSRLSSSSAMWAANAATVCPSMDALDNKVHLTPANLMTMFHRSIEADFCKRVFCQIFRDENKFTIHDPLPAHDIFSDEGAANHNRLCPSHGDKGLQIFVFGKEAGLAGQKTSIFPARQSKLANLALARLHLLDENYFINLEQNPSAIDGGAFHNDVVAVANQSVFLVHEDAFIKQKTILKQLSQYYNEIYENDIFIIEISNNDLPLKDAVKSYLFNSQLVTKPDGSMLLFSPMDCYNNKRARKIIEHIIAAKNPINEQAYFDISESMANGGGPACLRLRVVLTPEELSAVHPGILLNSKLIKKLELIIEKYYPDEFTIDLLLDKKFLINCHYALDEIAKALKLKNLYDF